MELGDVLHIFTIITTEPNTLVRPIHNRMPVIYDAAMGRQWLDHSFDRAMILAAVLRPWPSELMEAWDVSPLVMRPRRIAPIASSRFRLNSRLKRSCRCSSDVIAGRTGR